MRRVVLDDPIGELVLAAEELGNQPELGSLAHRLTVQTLRLDHAGSHSLVVEKSLR